MAAKRVLGLDLGPNSVGWALVENSDDGSRLIDLGVRVFPEGVANFDSGKEVSRSEDRRTARGMRRQTQRRRRRRRHFLQALQQVGLWPQAPDQQQALLSSNPYELRAKALDEPLSLSELGRVFLHLNQRRGFLSNSKRDKADKETAGMLAEIGELDQAIRASGCRTLGEWLYHKQRDLRHTEREENDRVRNRHTARRMLLEEFDAIWTAQQAHHPQCLTEHLKFGEHGRLASPRKPIAAARDRSLLEQFGLHGLLFFQRSLFWPEEAIGRCEREPKEPRCPKMDRRAQLFRLWQEINNLRYMDDSTASRRRDEQPLSDSQRALLFDKLRTRAKMDFTAIRKALGFLESVRFNLERGKRSQMQGMVTDALIAKEIGKQWHDRDEEQKTEIVALLVNPRRDDERVGALLAAEFGFSAEETDALLSVDLPRGYVAYSVKAINKLLPPLRQGKSVMANDPEDSALHAAGYDRRDERQRDPLQELPLLEAARECSAREINNPVVRRTLVEMRRVVNAVIREYGLPDDIHVEMGRDVKTRPKPGTEAYRKYDERLKEMREREAKREQAVEKLREVGERVTSDNILKILLWEEQNRTCIYSGKPIGWAQLFSDSGQVEIDHILPRSRSLDNSQLNKVVCFRQTSDALGNHDKGQRTPYQWLAESRPEQYEAILQRARILPYPKQRKFQQKEVNLDDFIARQLNDMRYAARAGAEYLRLLYAQDHHVFGLRGQLTAELRHQWGLDNVLAELPDSPAWEEDAKLTPGEKNRADHRHHAIDALLIALTDQRRLKQLAAMLEAGGVRRTGEVLADPWPHFREGVKERLAGVHVSHRGSRKVSGRLHEESVYGAAQKPGEWVIRKPVEALSLNEVEKIRDAGIRRIVEKRLKDHGIEIGRGKKKPSAKTMVEALQGLKMPSGVPIKKVRVLRLDQTIDAIRRNADGAAAAFVKPGNTHHACFYTWEQNGQTQYEMDQPVTLLEASRRLRNGEAIVRRVHSTRPNARFLMTLSQGDMVIIEDDGRQRLMLVSTIVSTQKRVHLVSAYDARRAADKKDIGLTPKSLLSKYKARKVTVDPLGRIRHARD